MDTLQTLDPNNYQSPFATYPDTEFGLALKQTAMLIKADVGLEVSAIDVGGWDTHFAQGASTGQMANLMKDLADGLAAFHADMFATQSQQYGAKLRETIEAGLVIPGVEYLRAQRLRRLFQEEVPRMFTDVDVLLTPATPAPAPRDLSTTGDPQFQSPWTYAGVPTIALPSGLSQHGMPLGIQLIAPALHEERLLQAARWCEATLRVSLMPPL